MSRSNLQCELTIYIQQCYKHTWLFVGSCLETKVFIGNLPAMGKGVGHHKVGQ